jgi:hypothetical protein
VFLINPTALFRGTQIRQNAKFLLTLQSSKTATKERILVAKVLWIKELPKYIYQKEASFPLTSRDLWGCTITIILIG